MISTASEFPICLAMPLYLEAIDLNWGSVPPACSAGVNSNELLTYPTREARLRASQLRLTI